MMMSSSRNLKSFQTVESMCWLCISLVFTGQAGLTAVVLIVSFPVSSKFELDTYRAARKDSRHYSTIDARRQVQSRTVQSRTVQSRTVQSRTVQSRTVQS